MCRLASIGDKDVVYDIGCGDGRLVITAVDTFNARRGLGIDIDPQLVELSKKNSARAGTGDRVAFRQQDALAIEDFSEATVVFLYLSDELNMRLRPVLRRTLKPGARIVSHRFRMGDWKPDASGGDHDLYLWNIER
ncbi:MAG: class I SAM-dependent methyltransferase [Planctomycetes bacterium]|nr:class I SAM-dependent methyltransferase [Planctomycetota bacterium]